MLPILDRMLTETSPGVEIVYSAPHTVITLPYVPDAEEYDVGAFVVFNMSTEPPVPIFGILAGDTFTAQSVNLTGTPLVMGTMFSPLIHLSTIFPRDEEDRPVNGGRTNLRYLKLWYEDSGLFGVAVVPRGGTARVYWHPAVPTDVSGLTAELDSGSFSVPIHRRNTEVDIYAFSFFQPLTISGYEWEGVHHSRMNGSRR